MQIGLRRQFSWILIGRVAGALIQALGMVLVGRWAGLEAFALFASVYGVGIFLQVFADFGLTTYIIRLRASDPDNGGIGAALRLGRNVTALATVVGSVVIVGISVKNPAFLELLLLPLWMASEKQVEAWLAIAVADGNTWQNATSLVGRRAGALVVLVASYFCGLAPILGYLAGLALFSLLAWLLAIYWTDGVQTDTSVSVRTLLAHGRPYWINSLSVQAVNFDVALVAAVASSASAGYYAAAARITTPLRIVPASFAYVLLPATTRAGAGNVRPFIKPLVALTAITTAMYAGLAVVLPMLVPAILGPSFAPAAPVIQIVCVGLIAAALTAQFNSVLQGWGYIRLVAAVSAATTAFCLIGVLTLSPRYGAIGAGVSLAASFGFQLLAQIVVIAGISRRLRRDDDSGRHRA